jgi:hypothetical protein
VILFDLLGSEQHPAYQELTVSNGSRQYDFLRSLVGTALAINKVFLSGHIIKALNFHAITCLHPSAGEYRPCDVKVGDDYEPPRPYQVQALMDDFVNTVNRYWDTSDAVVLTSFVLWRLNWIHPFINGNGRTARAASYFVLCVKSGGWLAGSTILPELIRQERPAYVAALKKVDASWNAGNLDLTPLHTLLSDLIRKQLNGSGANPQAQPAAPQGPQGA